MYVSIYVCMYMYYYLPHNIEINRILKQNQILKKEKEKKRKAKKTPTQSLLVSPNKTGLWVRFPQVSPGGFSFSTFFTTFLQNQIAVWYTFISKLDVQYQNTTTFMADSYRSHPV